MDVRDTAQVEAVIDMVDKEFGGVYVLVNNAGITRDNLAMRMKDEEWDMVIETNLKSVFRLSRADARHDERLAPGASTIFLRLLGTLETRVRPIIALPKPASAVCHAPWPASWEAVTSLSIALRQALLILP